MLIVWLFTDLLIKLMHSIFLKFVGQSNKTYSLVFSSLFSGVFLILLINIIDLNYFYNYTPIIHCTDSNEEDPYNITILSKYFDTSLTFNMRNIRDLATLGVIGKCTVSAVKAAPAPYKVGVAATTSVGLGAVAASVRVFEYLENNTKTLNITKGDSTVELKITPNPELGGTKKDVEDTVKDIVINSVLEEPNVLDGIQIILFCLKIFSVLGIISLVLYSLFIYAVIYGASIKNKVKNNIVLHFINFAMKSGKISIYFWGIFTLFNLVCILYFSNRLDNYLSSIIQ